MNLIRFFMDSWVVVNGLGVWSATWETAYWPVWHSSLRPHTMESNCATKWTIWVTHVDARKELVLMRPTQAPDWIYTPSFQPLLPGSIMAPAMATHGHTDWAKVKDSGFFSELTLHQTCDSCLGLTHLSGSWGGWMLPPHLLAHWLLRDFDPLLGLPVVPHRW